MGLSVSVVVNFLPVSWECCLSDMVNGTLNATFPFTDRAHDLKSGEMVAMKKVRMEQEKDGKQI